MRKHPHLVEVRLFVQLECPNELEAAQMEEFWKVMNSWQMACRWSGLSFQLEELHYMGLQTREDALEYIETICKLVPSATVRMELVEVIGNLNI